MCLKGLCLLVFISYINAFPAGEAGLTNADISETINGSITGEKLNVEPISEAKDVDEKNPKETESNIDQTVIPEETITVSNIDHTAIPEEKVPESNVDEKALSGEAGTKLNVDKNGTVSNNTVAEKVETEPPRKLEPPIIEDVPEFDTSVIGSDEYDFDSAGDFYNYPDFGYFIPTVRCDYVEYLGDILCVLISTEV